MVSSIVFAFPFSVDFQVDFRKQFGIVNPLHGCQFLDPGCGNQHVLVVGKGLADQGLKCSVCIELFPRIVTQGGAVHTGAVEGFRQLQLRACIVFPQLAASQEEAGCQEKGIF